MIEENKYQISALIWAEEKIEEKIFFRCLKSLSWCHQILLINIPSSFLKNIPPKIKEKVTRLELSGNQIKQLNMAIKKAKTRWIFFVKANEQVSKKLAQEIAKVKGVNLDKVAIYGREGITGERKRGEIGIHSIRSGDITGEHTVMFTALGERLELTHKAHSRDTFAYGTIQAIKFMEGKPAGFYEMKDVLKI